MIEDLEALGDLPEALAQRARAAGVYLIWRAQARKFQRVLVRDGRVEETSTSSVSGTGLQVFTEDGVTALASRDDLLPEAALGLIEGAVRAASGGSALGVHRASLPALPVARARAVPDTCRGFAGLSLHDVGIRLIELEQEWSRRVPGPSVRVGFGADLDAWRVVRSDGTDVLYAMPRCVIRGAATSPSAGARHTVGTAVASPDPRLLWDPERAELFLRRAEAAARLAFVCPTHRHTPPAPFLSSSTTRWPRGWPTRRSATPRRPTASAPRSWPATVASARARRSAPRTSRSSTSRSRAITPGSRSRANGVPRRRATIVDHGRLLEALTDPWSAAEAACPLTGAERAESFRHAPVSRG